MSNFSDYKKRHTDLTRLMPENMQSDVSISLNETLFNRFLSKDELKKISGTIGANGPRDLVEETPHREAFQLQPIARAVSGTTEHVMSWEDFLTKMSGLGVDTSRFAEWGRTKQFNWVPPIDMDKLINYQNYYWYDPQNNTSVPQYITIKKPSAAVDAKVVFLQKLIAQYGNLTIEQVQTPSTLFVRNDNTDLLQPTLNIHIRKTPQTVDPTDFAPILVEVVSSEYISSTNMTKVTIVQSIPAGIRLSELTLEPELEANMLLAQCISTGETGWDSVPFDSSAWDGTCLQYRDRGVANQWISQNKWIHRSAIPSTTIAYQAKIPIIEFDSDLDLNEWTRVTHSWKYRDSTIHAFSATAATPSIMEIVPTTTFGAIADGHSVWLGTDYGDLTGFLTPGSTIAAYVGSALSRYVTIVSSRYEMLAANELPRTVIDVAPADHAAISIVGVGAITSFSPTMTSQGHQWGGYHNQWLYVGSSEVAAAPKQPEKMFLSTTDTAIPSNGFYSSVLGAFAQEFTLSTTTAAVVLDTTLRTALIGSKNIRVYINGRRDYWSYSEVSDQAVGGTSSILLGGVTMISPMPAGTVIRVEVGSAAMSDVGNDIVEVRTIESDSEYATAVASPAGGTDPVCLCEFRKVEQVKTEINQYPLFDIFAIDGSPADVASEIFMFLEDQTGVITTEIGRRIVRNTATKDFTFEQKLLISDEAHAYRTIETQPQQYAYQHGVVRKWNGATWETRTLQGTIFTKIIVSEAAPTMWTGRLWYKPSVDTLFISDGLTFAALLGSVSVIEDPTLRAIWRRSPQSIDYVPKYVDKDRNEVPIGSPAGAWEIPAPLYYNSAHEDRSHVKMSEIHSHFTGIMSAQHTHPAFRGNPVEYFHALMVSEIDLAAGGTIKEFDNGLDIFLSSLMIDDISLRDIIQFSRDSYADAVQSIQDIIVKELQNVLIGVGTVSVDSGMNAVIDQLIGLFETNAYQQSIFGDSTSWNGTTGVKNWPISLVALGFIPARVPDAVRDEQAGVYQVRGHSGKLINTKIGALIAGNIYDNIISAPSAHDPNIKAGIKKASDPRADISSLSTVAGAVLTPGMFWYESTNLAKHLYVLDVVAIGVTPPPLTYHDGAMWIDTTPGQETLRIKSGTLWNVPAGFTAGLGLLQDGATPETSVISAWRRVDASTVFTDTMLEIESRLYSVFSSISSASITAAGVMTNPSFPAREENKFFKFVAQANIIAALSSAGRYVAADPLTWNYTRFVNTLAPSLDPYIVGGCWQDLYEKNFGTPYTHQEPWILQGYINKPAWWDATYLNDDIATYGHRTWKHLGGVGMWSNIKLGIVPAGKLLPNDITVSTGAAGQVKSWLYVPVNTTDVTSAGGVEPDGLLPPYTPNPTLGASLDNINYHDSPDRSLFTSPVAIVLPELDYVFGSGSPAEWTWRSSGRYFYDVLEISYEIDPAKTLYELFGIVMTSIGGLRYDTRTQRVPSHARTAFHGDINANATVFKANGLNQSYINATRSTGIDLGLSVFRSLWSGWRAHLGYQFGTFINQPSLTVSHDTIDITAIDHYVTVKQNEEIESFWIDALNVSVLKLPPRLARQDDENNWEFELWTSAPVAHDISLYESHMHPVFIDPLTNALIPYAFLMIDTDVLTNSIMVSGDVTQYVSPTITLTRAGVDDGTYSVYSHSYHPDTKLTWITLVQPLASGALMGLMHVTGRALPFSPGDEVFVTTSGMLPAVIADTSLPYFYMSDPNGFTLADTIMEAQAGVAMRFDTPGVGQHFASKLYRENTTTNGKIFRRLAVDKNHVRTIQPPLRVVGLQALINVIFGYSEMSKDAGFVINMDSTIADPTTHHPVSWDTEVDRLVDWLHGIRDNRLSTRDSFEVDVDPYTDIWMFSSSQTPGIDTGERVLIYSTGALPPPLVRDTPYYMIRDNDRNFRIASTPSNATAGVAIDILPTLVQNKLFVTTYNTARSAAPSIEVNPMRTGLWFKQPRGIISNTARGEIDPAKKSLFDQFGRPLSLEETLVLRRDKLSMVIYPDGVTNDVRSSVLPDPYDYIHISSANLRVDTFENVLFFNDYSANGVLLYDAFLGLNSTGFNVDCLAGERGTWRPNVGGSYLLNNTLTANIENSIEAMRFYHDTHVISETTPWSRHARALIGYDGEKDYFNALGLNKKTQFLFYRGLIQAKGSTSAVKALMNSRRFVDTTIDENWAVKIAEFGSSHEKEYPEMMLTASDTRASEARFQFVDDPAYLDDGWSQVSIYDFTRWYRAPEQKQVLSNESSMMYFEMKPIDKLAIRKPNVTMIRHDMKADLIDVFVNMNRSGITLPPATGRSIEIIGSYIPATGMMTVFRNGVQQEPGKDYHEVPVADQLFSSEIMFVHELKNDEIHLSFGWGKLVESAHFSNINSRIIELAYDMSTTDIEIVGYIYNREAQDAMRVIDRRGTGTLDIVSHWDPARGVNYNLVDKEIDIVSATDPARYNSTLIKDAPAGALSTYQLGDDAWSTANVGKIWIDTKELDYIPYYDHSIFSDDEVLRYWGRRADWAVAPVYEWVETTIDPGRWNEISANQSTQRLRQEGQAIVSGSVRSVIYQKDSAGAWHERRSQFDNYDVAVDTNLIVNKCDITLNNVERIDLTVTAYTSKTIAVTGKYVQDILGNMMKISIIDSVATSGTNDGEYTIDSVTFDQKTRVSTITVAETIPFISSGFANPNNFGTVVFYPKINLYVNGITHKSNFQPAINGVVTVTNVSRKDRVTAAWLVTSDIEVISAGVNAAEFRWEIPFTQKLIMQDQNTALTMFYFWVEKKLEPAKDNVMSSSSVAAAHRETSAPYCFFMQPLRSGLSNIVGYDITKFGTIYEELPDFSATKLQVNKVTRTESFSILATGDSVLKLIEQPLEVNGVFARIGYNVIDGTYAIERQLAASEFSVSGDVVTLLVPTTESDKFVVTYVYQTTSAKLPNRFAKLVTRGLRGVVSENNRYVMQFVRDFTLRTDLGADMSLKNKHAEWTLIREKQGSNIPRWLWDKLAEAMVGYKLSDAASRVPALDREIYDMENGTDTRIGIGNGQSIARADFIKATILTDLSNPVIDFRPIDINEFMLAHNNLVSNSDITGAMDEIYNTFGPVHVNRIFFAVIHDALASGYRYADLFKTSWVSLLTQKKLETR